MSYTSTYESADLLKTLIDVAGAYFFALVSWGGVIAEFIILSIIALSFTYIVVTVFSIIYTFYDKNIKK